MQVALCALWQQRQQQVLQEVGSRFKHNWQMHSMPLVLCVFACVRNCYFLTHARQHMALTRRLCLVHS
jgi:hypothetical protein